MGDNDSDRFVNEEYYGKSNLGDHPAAMYFVSYRK